MPRVLDVRGTGDALKPVMLLPKVMNRGRGRRPIATAEIGTNAKRSRFFNGRNKTELE